MPKRMRRCTLQSAATDTRKRHACGISKSSIVACKRTTRKRMCGRRTVEYIDKDGEVVALRVWGVRM